MAHLNFFSHERLTDRLYKVTEGYSMVHRMTIGVAVGDERILVIDTGMAMSDDLRQYIEALVGTGKPIICACTHLHPDHVSGAAQFDAAYCSHEDYPRGAAFAFSQGERWGDLQELCLHNEEVLAYCGEHMVQGTETEMLDIRDGDRFDLGGMTIECIALPGHTPGSMAFFDRAGGHVFTGDAINTDTHLHGLDRAGYRQYRQTLLRFIGIVGDGVTMHPAHLPMPMTIKVAKSLARACEDIACGNVADDPWGDTMFSYRNHKKPNNHRMYIHYVENVGVTYDIELTENAPHSGAYSFYSHEQVAERVYVVTENHSVVHRFTIGVVVGDNKILVIDSGMGMTGGLRKYIESFVGVERPMWCACTHGAIDHAGAACLFDRAFVSPLDTPMLQKAFNPEIRLGDLSAFSLYDERVMDYCRAHMIDNSRTAFEPLQEGDVFDLGGVTVRPIHTPGHAKGHMAFHLPAQQIVFTGDAVNIDTHIKALSRAHLRGYAQMLRRLVDIVGEGATMYASHTNRPHSMRVAHSLIAACEAVASGQTAGDPPGETIFRERSNNPHMRMHYHGNCCIVYNNDLG